jgi:hypothetical protein
VKVLPATQRQIAPCVQVTDKLLVPPVANPFRLGSEHALCALKHGISCRWQASVLSCSTDTTQRKRVCGKGSGLSSDVRLLQTHAVRLWPSTSWPQSKRLWLWYLTRRRDESWSTITAQTQLPVDQHHHQVDAVLGAPAGVRHKSTHVRLMLWVSSNIQVPSAQYALQAAPQRIRRMSVRPQ